MNKLTDAQKRMIVLGIGLAIVILGLIQGITKAEFFTKYKEVINEVTFVAMMIAAVLLFSIKRKQQTEEQAEQSKIEETKPEESQK